jgi:hypothetical protein
MRALAADRQAAAMPEAPIAAEVHQPLDVHRHFAPEVALDEMVMVDEIADLGDFGVRQLGGAALVRDVDLGADILRLGRPDAVNVLQRDDDALVGRDIDACDAGNVVTPLPGTPGSRYVLSVSGVCR